ncbi:hypothetical protein TIFTF001_018454 [Ficus carica]|uniref:Secreted protein n=1 Tax=Ficus carica TaxID=3494 RepID=A0AA88D7Z0_FICCA|nr:hypothetical protein TIFTF001_018454 [Ficus carica]
MVSRWLGGRFSRLVIILFWSFVSNNGELLVELAVLVSNADADGDLGLGKLEVPLAVSLSGDVCGLGATCYMLPMD